MINEYLEYPESEEEIAFRKVNEYLEDIREHYSMLIPMENFSIMEPDPFKAVVGAFYGKSFNTSNPFNPNHRYFFYDGYGFPNSVPSAIDYLNFYQSEIDDWIDEQFDGALSTNEEEA